MRKVLETIYEKIRTTPYYFQTYEDMLYMGKEALSRRCKA